MLGDLFAFGGTLTGGRMFWTEDRGIFVVYENEKFYRAKEIAFADAEWMQHKTHGVQRIVTFRANNEIHSFMITGAMDMQGNSINIDELVAWLAERVRAKK